jgi:hypothetical protein
MSCAKLLVVACLVIVAGCAEQPAAPQQTYADFVLHRPMPVNDAAIVLLYFRGFLPQIHKAILRNVLRFASSTQKPRMISVLIPVITIKPGCMMISPKVNSALQGRTELNRVAPHANLGRTGIDC